MNGDFMNRRPVQNKDDVIGVIFDLLDDNDAIEWKNDTTYTFLQAVAQWLHDLDEQDAPVTPTWQFIADMFTAAGN
jgi:hypothetical protein